MMQGSSLLCTICQFRESSFLFLLLSGYKETVIYFSSCVHNVELQSLRSPRTEAHVKLPKVILHKTIKA